MILSHIEMEVSNCHSAPSLKIITSLYYIIILLLNVYVSPESYTPVFPDSVGRLLSSAAAAAQESDI